MRDIFPSSDGNQGLKGDRGQKGEQGIRGPPGRDPEPANTTESSGGTVYIRWGRDECPESAQLVYHGKNVTHRGRGGGWGYSAFELFWIGWVCATTSSNFVFAFLHFYNYISVEHDEKPLLTKFYMNRFIRARDIII